MKAGRLRIGQALSRLTSVQTKRIRGRGPVHSESAQFVLSILRQHVANPEGRPHEMHVDVGEGGGRGALTSSFSGQRSVQLYLV